MVFYWALGACRPLPACNAGGATALQPSPPFWELNETAPLDVATCDGRRLAGALSGGDHPVAIPTSLRLITCVLAGKRSVRHKRRKGVLAVTRCHLCKLGRKAQRNR